MEHQVDVTVMVSPNVSLPPDTPARAFRIEPVVLHGLENEVTRAVWTGDSTKTWRPSSAKRKEPSKSEVARELILDALESALRRRIESDKLDADIAQETGLEAQTIRNLRAGLKKDGLIRSVPEKDDAGLVERWIVERTNAPRPQVDPVPGHPVTEASGSSTRFGLVTPDRDQEPIHPPTVTGTLQKPVTESVRTGLVESQDPLLTARGVLTPDQVEAERLLEKHRTPT